MLTQLVSTRFCLPGDTLALSLARPKESVCVLFLKICVQPLNLTS